MGSLKVFFVVFLFSRFSASIGTSEDSSQEFLQWCNEELENFQETEFVLPNTLPELLHGILKTKLENFDLTEVCPLIVASGVDQKISFEEMKRLWTSFRASFPSFYCNICNEMETKIKTKLLSNNSFEDMINDLVDNFPEDSRNDLLAEYQSFFTNDLQQKLMSESMCHTALPKCAQFSVEDFCMKSDFDSRLCNISHCFLCSICETGFMMLDYDILQSPEIYHFIYNLTHDKICPFFNHTIGTEHPMNGYTFCLTILDDLAMGIMSIINFYLNPYTMCYKELNICDPTVFTNDLLTCMCTGVQWPNFIEKHLCPTAAKPCVPCLEGCP